MNPPESRVATRPAPGTVNGCELREQGQGYVLESPGRLKAQFATFFVIDERGYAVISVQWKKGLLRERYTEGVPPVRHADAMRALNLSGFVTPKGHEYSFGNWPGLKRTGQRPPALKRPHL